jgi:GT2 family glycosyltransferase
VSAEDSVAAVLVAWNSMRWLPAALQSLAAQSRPAESVVIVDNASTDGVEAFLTRAYPAYRYVRNPANEGFASATNQGIALTSSAWVLTLNPDVVLDSRYLERLLQAASELEDAGSLTGLLRRPDGSVDSAGMSLRRYLLRPIDECVPPGLDGSRSAEPVFGACAAAALYRRAMLEDVRHGSSYFDPAFFAYFEDADLAWRAQHRGWKAYVVPAASALHARSSEGEKTLEGKLRSQRNRYLTLYKNLPSRRLAIDFGAILLVELLRMIRHPRTQAAGLLAWLKMRPRLREWRAHIQRTATASGSWYLKS